MSRVTLMNSARHTREEEYNNILFGYFRQADILEYVYACCRVCVCLRLSVCLRPFLRICVSLLLDVLSIKL